MRGVARGKMQEENKSENENKRVELQLYTPLLKIANYYNSIYQLPFPTLTNSIRHTMNEKHATSTPLTFSCYPPCTFEKNLKC